MLPGERSTQELGENLAAGFSVDRIVMTLTKIKRLGYLQQSDRLIIISALRMLQRILRRKNPVEIEQTLLPFIRDFSQEDINKLIGIVNSLLEKGSADEQEIKLLKDFFTAYGKVLLNKAQDLSGC